MNFNETYILSSHVIDRFKERTEKIGSEEEIEKDILKIINEGIEIFKQEDHKFIRYKDYIFPCVRLKNSKYKYKVKTILTWGLAYNLLFYIEHLD